MEERRENDQKIISTIIKINTKIESLESTITERLDNNEKYMQSQMSHIDMIIDHLLKSQEATFDKLLNENRRLFDMHAEQNIADNARHDAKINLLNENLNEHVKKNILDMDKLDTRIKVLEDAPAAKSYSFWKTVKDRALSSIIAFILGGGLIALILTLIKMFSTAS